VSFCISKNGTELGTLQYCTKQPTLSFFVARYIHKIYVQKEKILVLCNYSLKCGLCNDLLKGLWQLLINYMNSGTVVDIAHFVSTLDVVFYRWVKCGWNLLHSFWEYSFLKLIKVCLIFYVITFIVVWCCVAQCKHWNSTQTQHFEGCSFGHGHFKHAAWRS
jgi:hypothetical protein